MQPLCLLRIIAVACSFARIGQAIILLDTGNPQKNTSTPGDNSGWQYEGRFGGYLGTPIAPMYFITAKHIGPQNGVFDFHGEIFTTTASYPDPASDLQIWK